MPQEFSRLARLFTTLAGFTVLAACGGGGGGMSGGGNGGGGGGGGGGGATVTISGKITFDRLVFSATPNAGLNPNAPVESPAREVVVQAVAGGSAVASTTTDANGDYTLTVAASTNMIIRARAQMQKTGAAPTWTFTVRDNTDSDAVYVLDSASFNSGTTNVTAKNLRAPSDWNGNGYNTGRRAAPFAILDTVYQTKQLILSANSTQQFPALDLYWSEDNKPSTSFCPDQGNIRTSFYGTGQTDQCTTQGSPLPDGIYILGFYATGTTGDTDEYDQHVIAHEFGHYFEDRFSRSDSIGGMHSQGDRLDLRVAFGEGWGNAFGSMALNDPQYRDSSRGVSQDFGFNLETNSNTNSGWFSEASVGEFLWDVFDSVDDSGDNVSFGFTPIYNAMTSQQLTTTNALTSIFTFATALRAQTNGTGVASLLSREDINGSDDYGTNETNAGGIVGTLPVYKTIALNSPLYVCSVATAGAEGNKLGNRQFLRFNNDVSRTVQIRAQGVTSNGSQDAATDPDIYVHRRGQVLQSGTSEGTNVETVNVSLAAGDVIIEVLDFDATGTRQKCMNVTITG